MSLPRQAPTDAREVQLLRDLLGTAAHDVGGLASALALRAGTLTGTDGEALAAIATELRLLGRQLRQLRGPGGGELLAPTATGNIPSILALVERFGRSALGRGLSLVVHAVDRVVPPMQGDALTYGLLAILRALHDADLPLPAVVHITATAPEPAHVRVAVHVAGTDTNVRGWPARQLQWLTLAEHILARAHAEVHHGTDELLIVLPSVAP